MKGIEDKILCLKLNKFWKVIDTCDVAKGLCDLCAGLNCFGIDITYDVDANGKPILSTAGMRPVTWDEWITLPIRPWDFSIRTVKQEVRVPTILVAKNYTKVPKVKIGDNPSIEQIRMRDGDRCQYTNRKLKRSEMSLDHVVPKSRGGGEGWTNKVLADRNINSLKGNKLNSECGLKLLVTPVKPKEILRADLIRNANHLDWRLFLTNVD